MRPVAVHLLLRAIAHPLASFHPARMPIFGRVSYRFELTATLLFSFALAMVEGNLVGVIVKKAFESSVPKSRLDYAVAILAAAPEFANFTSFLWTRVAHGRNKVRLASMLQAAVAVLVGAIALSPRTEAGLLLLAASVIAARVCFAGVITLRVTAWRANYPRGDRARVTGKLAIIQSLIIGVTGLLVGLAMDWRAESFRVVFPIAACVGMIGAWVYSHVRLRRHRLLLQAEREMDRHERPSLSPLALWRTLAEDRRYALFMLWLFILGVGNLMLNAPLIITLREQFGLRYADSVVVMQTIPLASLTVFLPLWARLLDRVHVVKFRAIHSWASVAAQALVLAGSVTHILWLVHGAMVFQGVALAGGAVAWNLGHLDFAPPQKAAQYMAVHLTLNGVRGLLSPLLAVYLMNKLTEVHGGQFVFAVSIVLCVIGAVGYGWLARSMEASGELGDVRRFEGEAGNPKLKG